MITTPRLLAVALAVFAAAHAPHATAETPATAPLTKGQRIFAAHHSYFAQIPPILTELAEAAGLPGQTIATKMIGGSKSLYHWNVKDEDNQAKKALRAGAVDVLILTPVYLPDEGVEKFARFGLETNPNLRTLVMEFWLPFDEYQPHYYDPPKIPQPATVDHNAQTVDGLRAMHQRYFQEMDALVGGLDRDLGKQAVFVVPVGQAVIALREKIIAGQAPGLKTQSDLFTDKLGHPAEPLQALIAYTHFAVIYRRNPAGLALPGVLDDRRRPAEVNEALNHLLQDLAWQAVIHHPLSGVVAP